MTRLPTATSSGSAVGTNLRTALRNEENVTIDVTISAAC
jgi:hypothetical protein